MEFLHIISSLLDTHIEPHSIHFVQNPSLMWFIIIGNLITSIAYFSIPLALVLIGYLRKEIVNSWLFWLFCAFIFLCGITHLLHVLVFWYPIFAIEAVFDMVTGIVSIVTAVMLWKLVPTLVSTPTVEDIRRQNKMLGVEIARRKKAENEIRNLNRVLEEKVNERTRALTISEQRFNALYGSSLLGVLVGHINGTMIDANDTFLQMINYTRDDIPNLGLRNITPKEYWERDEKAVRAVLNEKRTYTYEKEYLRKDGTHIPVLVGRAALDHERGQYITFILDITARKQIEKQKDEFISIAGHELRTPLTAIKGYIQILRRYLEKREDRKGTELATKADSYIERLNELIKDLLDVSRIQAGKLMYSFSRFNYVELVKETVETAQLSAPNYTIICEECDVMEVYGDRTRLEQVLMNLLNNAVKYTPNPADRIRVIVKKTDTEIITSIYDHGIGVPVDQTEKIFERFYRAKSASRVAGLGIGLYVSKQIVERHKGRMWVENNEEGGSIFSFALPLEVQL